MFQGECDLQNIVALPPIGMASVLSPQEIGGYIVESFPPPLYLIQDGSVVLPGSSRN